MSFRRACLECGTPTEPGQSRCPAHTNTDRRQQRGRTPHADRLSRHIRFHPASHWVCPACDTVTPKEDIEVDHRVPLWEGGRDHPGNLQLLCKGCHRVKTTEETQRRNQQ